MKYIKISKEKLQEENFKLYQKIIKDFSYECVVFVSKGAYYIGQDLSTFQHVPLLEISARRKGNNIKQKFKFLLPYIPEVCKIKLREREKKSNFHLTHTERNIEFDSNIWKKYKNLKNILLVDDSIDTGMTIRSILDVMRLYFQNATIKVAALNCFEESNRVVKTDFYLYKNCLLNGPWSNDSKEYKQFMKDFKNWKNNQK